MNISIDSYRNHTNVSFNTILSKVKEKPFKFAHEIDLEDLDFSSSPCRKRFKNLLDKVNPNKERKFMKILNSYSDSHFDYEILGLGKDRTGKKWLNTAFLSLEDSLDIIVHLVTGANPEKIRSIDNYKFISRTIMNMDKNNIDSINLGDLIGLDDELDSYFVNLSYKNSDPVNIVLNFYSDLVDTVKTIFVNRFGSIVSCLGKNYEIKLSLCSYNTSTLVFKSDIPFDLNIEVFDEYWISMKTYEPGGYLSLMDDDRVVEVQ